MLTKVTIRNFKRFRDVSIELGDAVVFIGPNNAGKTTALQALALWDLAVRRIADRHGDRPPPRQRPGLAINRRDLVYLPVPATNLLWHGAHALKDGKRIGLQVVVEGLVNGAAFEYGVEFIYANEESLTARPMRAESGTGDDLPALPAGARATRVAFLPAMSGLSSTEDKVEPGAIAVRIGEGRTAEVLRNICYRLYSEKKSEWESLVAKIRSLFGVELQAPINRVDRGALEMTYTEGGTALDLSAAGRGLHQTLLLLAYLQTNPGTVLLLDEPDAHLEILRQRQIYEALTQSTRQSGGQLIAASHSEVLLNEAANKDMVISFAGRSPRRIDDRGTHLLKSLKEIGFEYYVAAARKGWMLYVEGSTDHAILKAFARTLGHPASEALEQPAIWHLQSNLSSKARSHFFGLRDAVPGLIGIAILDRDERSSMDPASSESGLEVHRWRRREIENYLCTPEILYRQAEILSGEHGGGPLFSRNGRAVMERIVADRVPPKALRDRSDRYWHEVKASDDLLDPVFEDFFEELRLPNLMRKAAYHSLAALVPAKEIDPQVVEVLDAIARVRASARGEDDISAAPPSEDAASGGARPRESGGRDDAIDPDELPGS
jgi:energy-coupling factor transporter ATP-binding protein EcfA2